jgi:hypothetical protein
MLAAGEVTRSSPQDSVTYTLRGRSGGLQFTHRAGGNQCGGGKVCDALPFWACEG